MVTRRSVIVGLAGVALLSLTTPYADLVLKGSRLCAAHLPIGSLLIFTLGLLTWNAFARRFLPRLAFSPQELLVAYSMMLFCAAIPSAGFVGFLFSTMAAPFYYADPANEYERLFWHHIPRWFAPHDRQLATAFYVGLKSDQSLQWLPWLLPTLVWTGFAIGYFFTVFCLGVLLRRQWAESEKLTFPLAQVPLNMVGIESGKQTAQSFFRNRLLWMGFALPFLVHTINSLHYYNPAFPELTFLRLPIGQAFTEPPMDALADLKLIFHFAIIGVGFLIAADVTLSFWFFEIVYCIQLVAFRVYGLSGGSLAPASVINLTRAEEMGAFLVLAALYFRPVFRLIRAALGVGRMENGKWRMESGERRPRGARLRLFSIFHFPFSILHSPSSDNEPLPLRLAALGFVGGTLLLCGFLVAAGMSPVWAVALFVVWYSVQIVLTRIVSAGGVLMVECSFMPWDILMRTVGFHGVGVRNLTLMGFPQQMLMFDQGVIPLPYTLDAFKIMSSAGIAPRAFARALWLGFGVALVVSQVTLFRLVHQHGALTLNKWFMTDVPGWPYRKLAGWLVQPFSTDWSSLKFMTIGGLVTFFLYQMHRRFLWFPLNPLGFVMASTGTLREMWFSLFLGWFCHVVVLRYLGHTTYRLLRPFFLGLIIGEFLTAGLWLIVDAIMGVQGHAIFPA